MKTRDRRRSFQSKDPLNTKLSDKRYFTTVDKKSDPDSNWIHEQTKNLSQWVNYIFAHRYEGLSDDIPAVSDCHQLRSSISLFYSQEKYSAVLSHCQKIMEAENEKGSFKVIEREVASSHLQFKTERDILLDLGLQSELFDLLFSYELHFLKLVLECLTGNVIVLSKNGEEEMWINEKSNISHWKALLKSVVIEKLLRNHEIEARYQKQKALSMNYEKKMKEEMRKYALSSFLKLFYLLDVVRRENVLKTGTLFVVSSPHKKSVEVLLSFCKEFLKGEGDFSKHLKALGFEVFYEQNLLDEYNYSVKNFEEDFKDGVMLTKLVELLQSSYHPEDISISLRVPAESRLQKIHNVKVALTSIWGKENSKIANTANAVVSGHVLTTISVLWDIIFRYQSTSLLSLDEVNVEVKNIAKTSSWGSLPSKSHGNQQLLLTEFPKTVFSENILPSLEESAFDQENSVNESLPSKNSIFSCISSPLTHLLMEWCQVIISQYGLSMKNLTSAIYDGKMLSFIIHYYHPSVITLRDILSLSKTKGSHDSHRKIMQLVKQACQSIGGIPWILGEMNSQSNSDKNSILAFLAYLFRRLVDSSKQVHAVRRIQRCFRKFREQMRASSNQNGQTPLPSKTPTKSSTEDQKPWRKVGSMIGKRDSSTALIMEMNKSATHDHNVSISRDARRMSLLGKKRLSLDLNGESMKNDNLTRSPFHKRPRLSIVVLLSQQQASRIIQRAWRCYNWKCKILRSRHLRLLEKERMLLSLSPERTSIYAKVDENSDSVMDIDDDMLTTPAEIESFVPSWIREGEISEEKCEQYESSEMDFSLHDESLDQSSLWLKTLISRRSLEGELARQYVERMEARCMDKQQECQRENNLQIAEQERRLEQERQARLEAETRIKLQEEEKRLLQAKLQSMEEEKSAKQWKRALATEAMQKRLQLREKSSKVIQRCWRGYHAISQYQVMKKGICLFQSNYRGFAVRQQVRRMIYGAITIQARFRRNKQHASYLRWRKAAIVLQCSFRKYQAIRERKYLLYLRFLRGVVAFQAQIRRHQAANRVRAILLAEQQRKAAIVRWQEEQRMKKRDICARRIQRFYHNIRKMKIKNNILASARKIQQNKRKRSVNVIENFVKRKKVDIMTKATVRLATMIKKAWNRHVLRTKLHILVKGIVRLQVRTQI